MNLSEACQSAREGNFISHKYFDDKQSMHEYNYDLYYEDGANLSKNGGLEFIEREEWAKDGWYIKYPKEMINKEKLKRLHNCNKGYMFRNNESYEDCIIK